MKCQTCGNEIGQEEVFCGHCGAANTTPAQPTEMIQQAPSARGGLLNGGQFGGPAGNAAQAGPAANSSFGQDNPNPMSMRGRSQPGVGGFYQDATEMVPSPGQNNFASNIYPQQNFSRPGGTFTNAPGGHVADVYAEAPYMQGQTGFQGQNGLQSGFQGANGFPTSQFTQGYGSGPNQEPIKRPNVPLIVGIVCLVFAVITVSVFGALFALNHNSSNPNGSLTQATTTTVATTAPTTAPTATPTTAPTATPTPSPIPTLVPTSTPAPDTNFSWCTACTTKGFLTEYPNGWGQGTTMDGNGPQFTSSTQSDIYADVKMPTTTYNSATDLLNADLTEFSTLTGYTASTTTSSAVIGGVTWVTDTISYTNNTTTEQVYLYATINGGKNFIFEFQAPKNQFAAIDSQYFMHMRLKFSFVTATN